MLIALVAFAGFIYACGNTFRGSGTTVSQPSHLSVSPSTIDFGSVPVGAGGTQLITLTNTGNSSVTLSELTVSGADFLVESVALPLTLGAGQSTSLIAGFAPDADSSITGSVSVVSNATNSPATIALSGSGVAPPAARPICGQPNDKLVHVPADWTTFTPPATGLIYVDPAFGCPVKRLTNSSVDEVLADGTHPGFMNYYSTVSAMNATDTMVLIISSDGAWRVKDLNGNVVVPTGKMPAMNGLPLWDASNGNVFYYTAKNVLFRGTISGSSVTSSVVHAFSEYPAVALPDKTDLSIDGQSFAMWGGTTTGTNPLNIFTYNMQTNTKKTPYVTACSQNASYIQGSCVHGITQTADDNVIIDFAGDGTCTECGNRLWNGSSLTHVQDKTNHIDTGYDLLGNSAFIGLSNSSTFAGLLNGCPSGWGIDVRVLPTLAIDNCLLDTLTSWHVSYRGNQSQPWVALSFFDTRAPGPEWFGDTTNFQAPSTGNWQLYEDEIILAKVDGSAVYRLAHARSRTMEDYWATPRAAISRDGKYVVFTSNMAYANGCPAKMHVPKECTDVYLIKVQ
jgi:hypothetical protein